MFSVNVATHGKSIQLVGSWVNHGVMLAIFVHSLMGIGADNGGRILST